MSSNSVLMTSYKEILNISNKSARKKFQKFDKILMIIYCAIENFAVTLKYNSNERFSLIVYVNMLVLNSPSKPVSPCFLWTKCYNVCDLQHDSPHTTYFSFCLYRFGGVKIYSVRKKYMVRVSSYARHLFIKRRNSFSFLLFYS